MGVKLVKTEPVYMMPTKFGHIDRVFVDGKEIGLAERVEAGGVFYWVPKGMRKLRNIDSCALAILRQKYDRAYREMDEMARLMKSVDP